MARPLTPDEILAAFRRWRVPHLEVPGWRDRSNRQGWGDITGTMLHHTASDTSPSVDRRICTYGHSTLSGPLCNFGGRDDGRIDIISAGAANHAGGGDPDVLEGVRRESYDRYPPATGKHHGEDGSTIGNDNFYGWETYYGTASEPRMADLQYRAAVLSHAAVIDALDEVDGDDVHWTSKSSIGHKEWSDWKPDPWNVDMANFRVDVQWCLDAGSEAASAWYTTGDKDSDPDPEDVRDPEPVPEPEMAAFERDRVPEALVRDLQEFLEVTVDGIFGVRTAEALQRWLGVSVDGIVGEVTVTALQRRVGAVADGIWGRRTNRALGRYLEDRDDDLVVDGVRGKRTIRALQEHIGAHVDGIFGRGTARHLQEWLGVRADGVVGKVTIRRLQRKIGAVADGIWGSQTTKALQRWLNRH